MKTKRVSAYEMEHHHHFDKFNKTLSWKQFGLIIKGAPFKNIPIILN